MTEATVDADISVSVYWSLFHLGIKLAVSIRTGISIAYIFYKKVFRCRLHRNLPLK